MNDAKLYSIIRAPRVSEKTARLQEVSNQYVFEVATDATKADIKVAVKSCSPSRSKRSTSVNVKGKNKAFKFRMGRRADWRKAYVTLAEGQSIDVMATA
jgi:large subunit ribosomal protein L23